MSDGGGANRDVDVPSTKSPAPTMPAADDSAKPRLALGSGAHEVRRSGRPSYPVKILFVSANPGDRGRLVLDEEYRAIDQRIRLARHSDAFRLFTCPAARRIDLQEALLKYEPHIVHFACHGDRQGTLALVGDESSSDLVSVAALAAMFEVLHDQLLLVVFNACFASVHASAIRTFARTTIGMQSQVTDKASIAFASALYGALAYGRSVQEAFDLGRTALNSPESRIPELFERTPADARRLHLVPRRRTRVAMLALPVIAVAGVVAALLTIERRPEPVPERRLEAASVRGPAPVPDRPFVLDTRLRVLRQVGPSVMLEELRSGDTLVDGDRLQLSLRTSTGGYLYVAFCSPGGRATSVPGLSVFPGKGAIRLKADEMLQVPAKLVVDDNPGPEALYLILSRSELPQADARLAGVLDDARRERGAAECGVRFRSAVARLPRSSDGADATAVQAGDVTQGTSAAPSKRDKSIITRGINATLDDAQPGVNADENGIVVMRYEFTHVPRRAFGSSVP